jgi:phosphopantothenate---cysteine ligase (CTP)
VTAGNTREAIDDVRDWGNIFTGNTGRDIAVEMATLGPVRLLTSNLSHVAEFRGHPAITAEPFRTHAELADRLAMLVTTDPPDAIFMTAAVADYKPAGVFAIEAEEILPDGTRRWTVRDVSAGKVSSKFDAIAVRGEPTEKIVDKFRRDWGFQGFLVKFKLEVGLDAGQLRWIGYASKHASGADVLVANTLAMARGTPPTAMILTEQAEIVERRDLAANLNRLLKNWSLSRS